MMLIHFLVSLMLAVSGIFSQAAANMASKGVTSQTTSGEGSAVSTGTTAAGLVGAVDAILPNSTGNHSLVFTQTYNVPAVKNASTTTGDTTSSAITTSWTSVTMVYTTVETFVYKPITRSGN
ncbi:hypothetical protein M406DRAFT_328612 [Cryphonectria parasitica EP155]|uniref:Uncharacterized protein n=1 Tax=Cryphonectria parasitica (strain ATCC 38755 / EP155) TaxID=660469 RepID=A0A9P5CRR1_CRYP1|nr:uncharacterized protein M406DRAFT_328612 [Cryphonectria parasitica EP155]KAF3767541.1 hypothetical protein M406DRAFT_328612 [Cryphonectria parasitica EP155]